jgi:hypothetical protein
VLRSSGPQLENPMSANLAAALITKLTVSNRLDSDDIQAILALRIHERRLDARQSIVTEGSRPAECCLIVVGFGFSSIINCM